MRRRNWVPRREEATPVKMSEVSVPSLTSLPSSSPQVERFHKLQDKSIRKSKSATFQPRQVPSRLSQPSHQSSAQMYRPRPSRSPSPAPTKQIAREISPEEFEEKVRLTLEEFLSLKDVQEVAESIVDLKAPQRDQVVSTTVNLALDKPNHIAALSNLLVDLHEKEILNDRDFAEGFRSIVNTIDDLRIDVPHVDRTVGKILQTIIRGKCLPAEVVENITTASTPLHDSFHSTSTSS